MGSLHDPNPPGDQMRNPTHTARPLSRHLLGAAILAFAATTMPLGRSLAQADDRGTWQLYYEPSHERVQLTFEHFEGGVRRHGTTSYGVAPSELRGLTNAQLQSANSTVRFQLVRDAGTFNFEGQIRDGHGTGFFTFAPDSRFPHQLASLGYERPTPDQQFWLALHDVGYAMVDELRADGYDRPSVDQLVVMGMHGANLDYIRSLKAAGYRVADTRQLVMLRDHGVTRDFIGGLSKAGYANLSLDDLLELRDHGVTPDFIDGLRSFGFKGLSADQLLEARDHGVTESFIQHFRELGYTNVSLREFVRLRDHGVTAGFAENMRGSDGRLMSIEDLIRRRDRGGF